MFRARSPRTVLVALSVAFASVALGVGASPSVASAASPHRAAVIVDTGSGVHRVVITFTEDSISGIEALQRAGASPVIYAMGPGAAVCRLYGVGRDASSNCLGGQDGDNRYWAYFRAPAGTSGFSYSSVGGGASRVHDGDVEGWKFGTGSPPAFASLASLAPPPPPPPPPPATTPPATSARAVGGSGPASVGSAAAGNPGTTAPLPPAGAAAAASAAATAGRAGSPVSGAGKDTKTSPSTKSSASTATGGRKVDTALARSGQGSGGSSAWSLLWFFALIAAIVTAIVIVRRVRRQHV